MNFDHYSFRTISINGNQNEILTNLFTFIIQWRMVNDFIDRDTPFVRCFNSLESKECDKKFFWIVIPLKEKKILIFQTNDLFGLFFVVVKSVNYVSNH